MPKLPPLPSRTGTDEEVDPRAGGNALGGVDAELGRLLDESPPSADCVSLTYSGWSGPGMIKTVCVPVGRIQIVSLAVTWLLSKAALMCGSNKSHFSNSVSTV